jgi:hypothetical protein
MHILLLPHLVAQGSLVIIHSYANPAAPSRPTAQGPCRHPSAMDALQLQHPSAAATPGLRHRTGMHTRQAACLPAHYKRALAQFDMVQEAAVASRTMYKSSPTPRLVHLQPIDTMAVITLHNN